MFVTNLNHSHIFLKFCQVLNKIATFLFPISICLLLSFPVVLMIFFLHCFQSIDFAEQFLTHLFYADLEGFDQVRWCAINAVGFLPWVVSSRSPRVTWHAWWWSYFPCASFMLTWPFTGTVEGCLAVLIGNSKRVLVDHHWWLFCALLVTWWVGRELVRPLMELIAHIYSVFVRLEVVFDATVFTNTT